MTLAILIYQTLGIIYVIDETKAQLGVTFEYRLFYNAPWRAFIFPGLFISLIMLVLILLHEGLLIFFRERDLSDESKQIAQKFLKIQKKKLKT